MKELKYLKTNSTAKAGVDYIGSIVNHHNCIFQEIDTKNDLGIDAIIEVIKDEKPTSNFLAVQIKSGDSYFSKKKNLCKIPVKNHFDYWTKHPLPVYGIVYIPEFADAYWVNIKKYLKHHPKDTVISFERTLANQLNKETFFSIFINQILNEVPDISFEFANRLFKSDQKDEFFLGLYTLFKKYANKDEVWDILIDFFQNTNIDLIPSVLVYYLSHCPWHPDLWYFNDSYTEQSQRYGTSLISKFTKNDVVKLLHFVDEENMLSRGSLGQSVEAIISVVDNYASILNEIVLDNNLDFTIREIGAVILAYKKGTASIPILEKLTGKKSWYISELIKHLNEYGEFNPYE